MKIHYIGETSGEKEAREIRKLDLKKKWFRCLRCGRRIWTDLCHRFCSRCSDANSGLFLIPASPCHPERVPITLSEIGAYGLQLAARQSCGEMELTIEEYD